MTKSVVVATIASVILGLAMISGAVYWQLSSTLSAAASGNVGAPGGAETTDRTYTVEELAQHDGKDNNDCLVAADGDVYLIEGFALWQNGEHLPSGGRARCGLDLTQVIDQSPHGRSKLQLLKKVGTLG